jgi:hypothetical protein
MTNFDDDLRNRLARLDAAMPTPAAPVVPIATRRRLSRGRQGFTLLAAAAMFLGVAAIAAVAVQPDTSAADEAQRMVEQGQADRALAGAFEDDCFSVDAATALIRERLDAAGLRDWTIRATESTTQATCVAGAYSGDPKEILLMPSMGGPLAKAVEDLRTEMRASCYDRKTAIAMVQAVLDANGQGDRPIEVRGIAILPADEADAYEAHIKSGCYVYESSQWDGQGRRTFFIAGP